MAGAIINGADSTLPVSGVGIDEALLLKSIRLEEVDTDVYMAASQDLYVPPGARGVFGGQTVCQTLHAAILTVKPEYAVHSFHGYFLLAGDASRNIVYHVNRVRDGKSFATRSVQARQRGKAIFAATLQFQQPEANRGIEINKPMPAAPGPDGIKSDREWCEDMARDEKLSQKVRERFQRILETPHKFERRRARMPGVDPKEPVEWVWMKVRGQLGDNVESHLASIAYMSDAGLLDPAFRPAGGFFGSRSKLSMIVSLDHSMWFHAQDFRADDWLLFETRCIQAGSSRALCQGQAWSRDGKLVFSCMQEGLLRFTEAIPTEPSEESAKPKAKL
mmetsp:Transcript_54298/g.129395  ORF Transcript_54298/g.129395 Transcript_54298/m.129395 type:complete len:333 (+) Transcript_54298:96-1094(+)